MRSFSTFWLSKESKLEQVWMTHLFNLMDFDSFQPVTGIPPLGCIAWNFPASCFVFALLRHDNLWGRKVSEVFDGFCLWKEKINTAWAALSAYVFIPFEICFGSLSFALSISLPGAAPFPSISRFLSLVIFGPFLLHGVNWARVPLCISEGIQ